jgi:FKBP-type peptidyl-prolyl cis-trans isomerase
LVPAELAYGAKGELEIPPNTDIEMQVEILERRSK